MSRNLVWKFLLVVFVVAWSVYELYPPTPRSLLEVFKERAVNRDAAFTNIVQEAEQLSRQKPGLEYAHLLEAIGDQAITQYYPFFQVQAELDKTRGVLNRLQQEAAGQIKLGLDLQGGISFLIELQTNETTRISPGTLNQTVEIYRRRVDRLGVAEPIITPVGENRISIQLPGLSEAERESAAKQIQQVAKLEFRLLHPNGFNASEEMIVPGYEIRYEIKRDVAGNVTRIPYLVSKRSAAVIRDGKRVELDGSHLQRASMDRDPTMGLPYISFTLTSEGASIFKEITTKHQREYMAILLDGQVYSAPQIETPITEGRGIIRGTFTEAEAMELANILENPLKVPVIIREQRTVDPSLGRDSVRSGVQAALIGTVAVALFMIVYYLLSGVVSVLALVLNLVILMGVMCSIDATLTMPGIAGIVLTIGMAVDANVLIFERIREELRAGKSLRGAIAAGYEKAFSTIFDSNITTLISAIILIYMGTGPVKGFGVTLTIGIAASMFTSLVVTRLVFDFLVSRGLLKTLPMLRIIGQTKIDFLRYALPAFVLSWLLIVVGAVYGLKRGSDVLGVDFKGGDSLLLTYQQMVPTEQIRGAVQQLQIGEPQISYQASLVDPSQRSLEVLVPFEQGEKVFALLKEKFPEAGLSIVRIDQKGPSLGKEIQITAITAILLSLFGILLYVAFRYEFSFAIGAVIAIFHDVLMTLGWFFLTGRELNTPMVAAILTIIGFSINDTIVIFDRIREDLRLGIRGSFREIMNQAINQTLSRTIITSGTVFLSTMSLFLFGGSVINDFAFTFLVGILTGTYSTIYIAGAIVLWLNRGERPKLASSVTMESPAPARP